MWTLLIDRRFDSNDVSVQCKSRGRINRKKKAKKHQYPTFPDQYLPTPLERSEVWCNKIFTLVPTLNPSLCFVTEQSSGNSEKEKQRQNLDSGAFRPRVITTHHVTTCGVLMKVFLQLEETLSEQRRKSKLCRTYFMTVPKCIYGNDKPML